MISITSSQLDTWFGLFIWPFLRILGLMLSEPLLGHRALPRRIKMGLALLLTLTIAPMLPAPPSIGFTSAQGIVIAIQQLFIGFALGFSIRLVLSSIEMAGHVTGLTMGLGFAVFFDPQNSAQSPVLAQFIGIFAMLVFLAMNGHLMVISALVQSFQIVPISTASLNPGGFYAFAQAGGQIFLVGLMLSLPMLAALLIANIAMGILSRAAPQLNLFAVGFPLTLTAGFAVLLMALPYLLPPITRLLEEGVLNGLKLIGLFRAAG